MKATVPGDTSSGLLEVPEVLPFKTRQPNRSHRTSKVQRFELKPLPHLQIIKPTTKDPVQRWSVTFLALFIDQITTKGTVTSSLYTKCFKERNRETPVRHVCVTQHSSPGRRWERGVIVTGFQQLFRSLTIFHLWLIRRVLISKSSVQCIRQ